MKRLNLETAEKLAWKTRNELGMSLIEPVNVKTVLRQLNILTVYRPLSKNLYGLSLRSATGKENFMLINSKTTRGRQHFSVMHELFHLMYDEKLQPHFCCDNEPRSASESSADLFASAILMPREGLVKQLTEQEIAARNVPMDTAIRIGQLYGVSHKALALRLKALKLISQDCYNRLTEGIRITHEASIRGLDTSLYKEGNNNLVLGDFGILARTLYDEEKISESSYLLLLKKIGYGEEENCIGC